MSSRTVTILRWSIALLAVASIVMVALIGKALLFDKGGSKTPRTELERALFAAQEAVKADPQDPSARVKLAAAFLETGNTGGAVEQAGIAIRLAPKDPAGYYVLGMAEVRRGQSEQGIKDLKRAVGTKGQLAQFYQDAYVALAHAYEGSKDTSQAVFAMDKAVNYGPENVILLYERGAIYERAEDWVNALDDYASALEYVPNYEPARTGFDRIKAAHPDAYDKLAKEYGIQKKSGSKTTTPAAK